MPDEHARTSAARHDEGAIDADLADTIDRNEPFGELLKRLRSRASSASRYRIGAEVGRGGMGAVSKVWDEDLRRSLAMKVALHVESPAETGETDARSLARFLEEAQVTGQLDHPGIVPVHELGLDEKGRVYFTMKLVRGRDLAAVYELVFSRAESWTRERALGVLLKACEALAFAHKKGVLHRDLKPSNVMVGDFGEVYVMDWGLARVVGRADRHDVRIAPDVRSESRSARTDRRDAREETPDSPIVTMDGDVVGTPSYMAPEQARGEVQALTARADVYSVGAMLYHLLAGQRPYVPPGARVSARTVLGMVLQGPPVRIETLRNDVPAELVAICEKAMERDARARYADTLELAEDLRAYLENRVVRAHATGAWVELRKWVGRNRGMAAAIALLVLVLAAGGTAASLFFRDQARKDEIGFRRERAMHDLVTARSLLDRVETLANAPLAQVEMLETWLATADEILARGEDRLTVLRELAGDATHGPLASAIETFERVTTPQLVRTRRTLGQREQAGRALREQLAAEGAREITWTDASRAIAGSPAYAGLVLPQQKGLVPLGRDAESGLWEFWHVDSGQRPQRNATTGRWVVAADTGIVLVLLPGATCSIGSLAVGPLALKPDEAKPRSANWDEAFALAQRTPDWTVPWHDLGHRESEAFVQGVVLDAFFISKYELTRGQWARIAQNQPSRLPLGDEYPVESVSWIASNEVMLGAGLALPTEAQWEYACRAGTASPFWTGWTIDSLNDAANVADLTYRMRANRNEIDSTQLLDDGVVTLARAEAYRPNPFGLHNVHGNVWEWCADSYGVRVTPRDGDGWNTTITNEDAGMIRGGSYFTHPVDVRSANRYAGGLAKTSLDTDLGLRPARAVDG